MHTGANPDQFKKNLKTINLNQNKKLAKKALEAFWVMKALLLKLFKIAIKIIILLAERLIVYKED